MSDCERQGDQVISDPVQSMMEGQTNKRTQTSVIKRTFFSLAVIKQIAKLHNLSSAAKHQAEERGLAEAPDSCRWATGEWQISWLEQDEAPLFSFLFFFYWHRPCRWCTHRCLCNYRTFVGLMFRHGLRCITDHPVTLLSVPPLSLPFLTHSDEVRHHIFRFIKVSLWLCAKKAGFITCATFRHVYINYPVNRVKQVIETSTAVGRQQCAVIWRGRK